ncbi:MAG: S8 family serine peptidase [Caldilineaceae bacterium]|nr:S8 family serine peptidase [Caldilineaceae bacterium]
MLISLSTSLLPLHPSGVIATAQAQEPEVGLEAASGQFLTIRGKLLSLPLLGLGAWSIRTPDGRTHSVIVLNLNVLKHGILLPGTWVHAQARLQLGGLVVATQIRIDDYEPGEVVARLAPGVAPETIAHRYNLSIESTLLTSGNIHLFRTPSANDDVERLSARMAQDPDVVWAELNLIGQLSEGNPYKTWGWSAPDSSNYVNQAAFEQVNLAPALAHYDGEGIIVAILDTGIDLNHPSLAGRWIDGWDMVADDPEPQDEGPGNGWGHGTHIAGIILPIAPQSKLLPVRVLNSDGRGNVYTLAYAIEWAVERGAHVLNLSLGTNGNSSVLREVVEQARSQGVIVVAAAGNANASTLQYPVGYEGVLGVTALTGDNRKADFANYGAWVDLAAPGVGITSTIVGPNGSGFAVWSGTSMATAFVTGAAALARQHLPDGAETEIAQLLTGHARDVDAPNPGYEGALGRLLNIGDAVAVEAADSPAPNPSPTPGGEDAGSDGAAAETAPPDTPDEETTPAEADPHEPETPAEGESPDTSPDAVEADTPVEESESNTPAETDLDAPTEEPASAPPADEAESSAETILIYLPVVRR